MNGAEILVKTAVASGIDVCFANPGTTEVTIVNALDAEPKVRMILGLFEGVCSGAADGYGRLQGKPAMNLLHQGPGFANSIGNMHNGQRAGSPMLNIIGDHLAWHRDLNPLLYLDIEALAATLGWCKRTRSVESLPSDISGAIAAAQRGQIASLIVPQDHQIGQWTGKIVGAPRFTPEPVEQEAVNGAAKILRSNSPSLLMLGGSALRKNGLHAAVRISAATGCSLYTETFPLCWDRGAGLPNVERTLYRPGEQTILARYRGVVLAGLGEPLTYFGREGYDSRILKKDQEKALLVSPGQDVVDALERLAEALGAPDVTRIPEGLITELDRPDLPEGRLTVEKASQILAAIQPDGAIIVEEGITACSAYYPASRKAPPHTILTVAGGNIGWGIPCAIGAALACPDRPVISFEGDGSAMYTIQALWTQARESLNITTLIFSNRLYNAVRLQFTREGASPGPAAEAVTGLDRPPIGWVKLSQGLGVPAESVTTSEELARALRIAFAEPGPRLIEIVLG